MEFKQRIIIMYDGYMEEGDEKKVVDFDTKKEDGIVVNITPSLISRAMDIEEQIRIEDSCVETYRYYDFININKDKELYYLLDFIHNICDCESNIGSEPFFNKNKELYWEKNYSSEIRNIKKIEIYDVDTNTSYSDNYVCHIYFDKLTEEE